jgi:hypothetical protein
MPHAQISKNIFDHAWNVKLKVAFDEQNIAFFVLSVRPSVTKFCTHNTSYILKGIP